MINNWDNDSEQRLSSQSFTDTMRQQAKPRVFYKDNKTFFAYPVGNSDKFYIKQVYPPVATQSTTEQRAPTPTLRKQSNHYLNDKSNVDIQKLQIEAIKNFPNIEQILLQLRAAAKLKAFFTIVILGIIFAILFVFIRILLINEDFISNTSNQITTMNQKLSFLSLKHQPQLS
jgi:hypothetical protein